MAPLKKSRFEVQSESEASEATTTESSSEESSSGSEESSSQESSSAESSSAESSSAESSSEESSSEESSSEESSSEESSSEDSSSEEGDFSSSEEGSSSEEEKVQAKSTGSRFKYGHGVVSSESSESEEDTEQKVALKSTKDKRFSELEDILYNIDNAKKIGDWISIQNEFDSMAKSINKAAAVFRREGFPPFFIKGIADLEDYLKDFVESNKNVKSKMNASNARALNAMKQKIRKFSKPYESDIAKYRRNPEAFIVDATEEIHQEEDQAALPKKSGRNAFTKSESEEESEEEAQDDKAWEVSGKQSKKARKAARAAAIAAAAAAEPVYTPENLMKKLREVIEARGRKSTDKLEQISVLEKLLGVANTTYQKIRVLVILIAAFFDSATTSPQAALSGIWSQLIDYINRLVTLLEENPHIKIGEGVEEALEGDDAANELRIKNKEPIVLRGAVASFVERLDDEFYRMLLGLDPHTTEYIDRLRTERDLYTLIIRSQKYFEKMSMTESNCQVVLRRLEHIYYKPSNVIELVEAQVRSSTDVAISADSLIEDLAKTLYRSSSDRIRSRAVLCHVYYHALRGRYFVARDLFLMSHVMDHISHADISTQMLYNRTLVQLGLCAFRLGMIQEAFQALHDILSSLKQRELLGQGYNLQRNSASNDMLDQERLARQLPFHMHINLELLECVYLTCCMLLEIPHIALNPYDHRRKFISKVFKRMYENSTEKAHFNSPPESVREYIIAASVALANGDSAKCCRLLFSIKVWNLLSQADEVKLRLENLVKEEALRTYLLTFASNYDSIKIAQLTEMFNLSRYKVDCIIARMIIKEELPAAIDSSTDSIVITRTVRVSKLEFLANQYADKVSVFVESNFVLYSRD